MSDAAILRPAEAAHQMGVPTRLVVQAMYERRVSRVLLDDGTLGIPANELATLDLAADPAELATDP